MGYGIVTPGHYNHRPYLKYYGIPDDLSGKNVLDIGAASGFFSFEMEKRGAKVTATELKTWMEHDFGPYYRPDRPLEELSCYLDEPFKLVKKIIGSNVRMKRINIYDISPKKVGEFDLVFCSSVLLHVTDPIKALRRIRSVTRDKAIIATGINKDDNTQPLALFSGLEGGNTWWLPNRAGLEAMVEAAGFSRFEWFSDFRLDYRDGRSGVHHGVVHAFKAEKK